MEGKRVLNKAAPSLDWPFAQQCARAEDFGDIRDLLQVEIARLGFRFFCCCSHVAPDRQATGTVYLHNYPRPWVDLYNKRRLFNRDPVYIIGRDLSQPFLWTDPRFIAMLEPDQIEIMQEAANHGLTYGATIPLHGPGRYSASCSVIADAPIIEPDRIWTVQRFAMCAYEAGRVLAGPAEMRPRIILPRRQRQCIEQVALGKDDETIAIMYGLERDTVTRYVEMGKHRLGATKRPQAVALAIYTQAINLEDLFGA